jgi:hypothetical protein
MTKGLFTTVDFSLAGSAKNMRDVIERLKEEKITDLEKQADRTFRASYPQIYGRVQMHAKQGLEETSVPNDFLTDEERDGLIDILSILGYTVSISTDHTSLVIKVP